MVRTLAMERRNSITKLAAKKMAERYNINLLQAADQVSGLKPG